MTSAVLKSFLVEVKLYTLFFPLCPFNSFGRGQHSWALKHLEGHSVHEFVLAFISAFFILFYPLPRGHFDWHGSQVKRSAYSKGHVCHNSVRITFLCLMRSDFFPHCCVAGGSVLFPWPCQYHSLSTSFTNTIWFYQFRPRNMMPMSQNPFKHGNVWAEACRGLWLNLF